VAFKVDRDIKHIQISIFLFNYIVNKHNFISIFLCG
jgi:hypothetical protein